MPSFLVDFINSPNAVTRPVERGAVRLGDGFWKWRRQAVLNFGLQHGYEQLVSHGSVAEFEMAAGEEEGAPLGYLSRDSDVNKWMQAASYGLTIGANASVQESFDLNSGDTRLT